jgi:hypothetical protein
MTKMEFVGGPLDGLEQEVSTDGYQVFRCVAKENEIFAMYRRTDVSMVFIGTKTRDQLMKNPPGDPVEDSA